MTEAAERDRGAWTGAIRLGVGLAQGLVAWLLIRGADEAWSAQQPALFAALVLVTAFPPLIVLAGLGQLRPRTLLLWTLSACIIVAGLSGYDHWREPLAGYLHSDGVRRWPSPQLISISAVGLYIAHHLIEPADVERLWWPSYQARFERAWRHGFQLALAIAFTGVFWLVLQLGSALFDMIGVNSVGRVIHKTWFASPATATVFAGAVHLTDVRPNLIRGLRTVGLTLLAWLTPLAAGLTTAFLLVLPFTGLAKLWATRHSASLLLSAAAVLIVLMNAAYQDGRDREELPGLLRWSVRVGAILLVPLTGLAAWATLVRIGQYGLTPERVGGLATLITAAVYAGGYTWAALAPGRWMRRLEDVNVVAAILILGLILALFSPLADPARLSTDDQMHRLEARRTPSDRFDFAFFRFRAARFGRDALDRLAKLPDPAIAERARKAMALTTPYPIRGIEPEGHELAFSHAEVLPRGAVLPASFRHQDWTIQPNVFGAGCLSSGSACDIYIRDLNGDGKPEVLVSASGVLAVYGQGPDGRWVRIGSYGSAFCPGVQEALRAAQVSTLAPLASDLEVGGQRLGFEADSPCRTKIPAPPPKPVQPPGLGPAFTRR